MALMLSDPFTNEIDRAMNRMLSSFGVPVQRGGGGGGAIMPGAMDLWKPFTSGLGGGTTTMPMDIIETPEAFELHCDTPGMNPDDVKVELHEGVLTVSGGRKVSREDKDVSGKVWRAERSSFSFSRAFTLPDNAQADSICASMDNGVLKVCIPKKEVEKVEPKRIAITGGGGQTTHMLQQPAHMGGGGQHMQHGAGGRMHQTGKQGGMMEGGTGGAGGGTTGTGTTGGTA